MPVLWQAGLSDLIPTQLTGLLRLYTLRQAVADGVQVGRASTVGTIVLVTGTVLFVAQLVLLAPV